MSYGRTETRTRRLSSFFAIATVTVLVLPAGPSAIAADPRPNILLVLTDDHSVPHIGCYGNADVRTPHLDRFATRGMRFDRMYVTAPQCVPARATIMTGQSSVKIGMTRFSAPLARDVLTFPELLRDAGYRTGLVGRTYHLDGHDVIASKETKRVFSEHDLVTFPDRVDFVRIAQGGVGHVDQMAEFLDGTTADRPWFLQLSFDDPHRPLSVDAIDEPHDPREINLPTFMPDTDAVRADLARYYDEVARFDADFGRAMRLLADRGLDGTTCVIFMGDNGAALLRGKGTLYELGLHVPMLVCWEGVVTAGSHAADLISSEDIAPTLLEIAGVSAADGMDGVSFASLLRGKKFYGRKSLCAARGAHGYNLPLNTADFDLSRCVVTDRYKLIYNPLWRLPYTPVDMFGLDLWHELERLHESGKLSPLHSRIYFANERPIFELYDLRDDPDELENLISSPKHASIEHELKATLHEWMILQNDFVPLPIPDLNPFLKR